MLLASTIDFPDKPCWLGTLQCILSNSVKADFWLRPSKNFPNPLFQRIKGKIYDFWTIPAGFTWESQGKGFGTPENSNDFKNFAFSFNHWLSCQTLAVGDVPTRLFELVQSRFFIIGFKNLISSLLSTLCKQKSINLYHFQRIPLGLL